MLPFPQRRRVYLMRHGEVSYFDGGRPLHPEGVSLNAAGRQQAEAAALALADVPLDRAVSSGLSRTDETAQIIVGRRDIAIGAVPALREIRSGRLSAIPPERLIETFTQGLTRQLTPDDQFLMGETFGSLRERVLPAFHALVADRSWCTMTIKLVTHTHVLTPFREERGRNHDGNWKNQRDDRFEPE